MEVEHSTDSHVSMPTSVLGVVHMDARALLDINLIWFSYIACLMPIPLGRRGYFTRSNDFYLPSLRLEEGGQVGTLWRGSRSNDSKKELLL